MLKPEAIQALLNAVFNTRTNGEVVTIFTGTDQSDVVGEMLIDEDGMVAEFWAYPLEEVLA